MMEGHNIPLLILQEPYQTIQVSDNLRRQLESSNIHFDSQIRIQQKEECVEAAQAPPENDFISNEEEECVFQIVYPHELNLIPTSRNVKRGRPKKKKIDENREIVIAPTPEDLNPPKTARTRSGRLVKLPKYFKEDFKRIETNSDELDVEVSDFKRFEEKENSHTEFTELYRKKRVISAQYKCPKCLKAYLGKGRMIQHLKKYPEHGPLPEGYEELNFDVWNYLFDITQKCKPGQRGVKFCQELSNLLHNLQLLKSALFKTVTDNRNAVQIDKVLGNAIGLAPGKYGFDENELYKDVTVLKLITNSDFFKPNQKKNDIGSVKTCQKIDEGITCQDNTSNNESMETSDMIVDDLPIPLENVTDKKSYNLNIDKNQTNIMYNYNNHEATSLAPDKNVRDKSTEHIDLLAENMFTSHSLTNTQNSVDELLVDTTPNLLDNSTSSDEVMNVDQFVNERFKKIIEPDIELGNNEISLDLPGLDLFQFSNT